VSKEADEAKAAESEASDRDALRACSRRELAGLEQLYRKYGNRVYSIALRILADPGQAEDVLQEVFLTVFRRAETYAGEANVTTWLYRVATNAALNWRRERGRRQERERLWFESTGAAFLDGGHADASLDASRTRAALQERLAKLPEKHRICVILHDVEGLSYEETATILQVPVGTLTSRLARAREALRQALGKVR
jgi:RNA polymerase sigma-70 factor (ECF subfamily)